jgi:AraC-like DNA-binding protein
VVAFHCRFFLRELRARGIDAQSALSSLGISYSEREDLHQFISAAQFRAFLSLVEELAGDPNVGLLAGERARAEDTGLLGLLVRSSPDGRSAYDRCNQYRAIVQEALDLDNNLLDGVLVCRRRNMPGVAASPILSEYFLARTLALTRQLFGPIEPLEVRLMHPAPADVREHVRVLGKALSFRQRDDAVVFPAELLSRPLPHHDPVAAHVLEDYISRLPKLGGAAPVDVGEAARQAIREQLRRGRATMAQVANKLMVSERTLHRQLGQEGTSFQQLLDEVRRNLALQYLREPRYSASELSARLGFNAPAAFYRAFRRWTGSAFSEYRAEHAMRAESEP